MTCIFSQTVQKTIVKSPAAARNSAVQQNMATKTPLATNNIITSQSVRSRTDSAKATLADVSFLVSTLNSSAQDPGTNKAADTHWSCTLFDQNNREVASFQDNSNTDEYGSGSTTPLLKMQTESAVTFGDFQNGGRLHISIVPSGDDTWEISEFDLNLGFSFPNFTSKLKWSGIRLTQDNKDVDVFFSQQNNGALKYDLKANRRS